MEQRNVDTLAGLIVEIRKLNTAKGWRDHFPANQVPREGPWFAAYCALATSEVSEALDEYRIKNWSSTRCTCGLTQGIGRYEEHTAECDRKPIGVGPEIADALIRILDMADIWEVDIEYELARVIDYGWTRPYQHGGKTL